MDRKTLIESFSYTRDLFKVIAVYQHDKDHVLQRRFQRLHLCNLYQKHKVLVDIDEKIAEVEAAMTLKERNEAGKKELASDAYEQASKIPDLLNQIHNALQDFDSASRQYERSINAPTPHAQFLKDFKDITLDKENAYHEYYDIQNGWSECAWHSATKKGPIHRAFDRIGWIRRLFKTDIPKEKQSLMLIYSGPAVKLLGDITINIIFCLLLIIPLVLLSYLKGKVGKLILISIFIIASAIISSLLANKVHNTTLAAMATYTAILVVFLSNNSGN